MRLAFRLVMLALALLYLTLRLPVMWWLAVAALVLWVVFELVDWRRRAPQRAAERQQREQRRAEVAEVLDYYERTHPDGEDAGRSPAPPPSRP
jgi:membrane protein implicated in regulation of membrane protease activity